jgi:hypothetical protein
MKSFRLPRPKQMGENQHPCTGKREKKLVKDLNSLNLATPKLPYFVQFKIIGQLFIERVGRKFVILEMKIHPKPIDRPKRLPCFRYRGHENKVTGTDLRV